VTVQVLECNRRRAIHLLSGLIGYVLFGPRIQIAFAQPAMADAGHLSTSEKILLDGLLYKDVAAYLAFDQVADQVSHQITQGEDAAAKFDAAYEKIQAQAADIKSDALNSAIRRGIMLNCALTSTEANANGSIERLFASTAPALAVAGTIARQVRDSSGIALTIPKSANELIDTIAAVELIPIVPTASAGRFLDGRIKMLAQESGITGVIAQAMGLVAKDQKLIVAVHASFDGMSQGVSGWADGIGKLAENRISDDSFQEMQGMAAAMSAAVDLLQDIHGMNQKTVSEVSHGINIAGAALSGAMAGASFGPIGAVVGGAVGLIGGLLGGHGGSDRSAQALARMQGEISQLGQAMNQLSEQMAVGFDTLSKQMNNGFTALSSQIQSLQNEVRNDFSKLEADIQKVEQDLKELLNIDIQAALDALRANVQVYELQYRMAQIDPKNSALQTAVLLSQGDVLKSAIIGMESASKAFDTSFFVGDMSFAPYLASYSSDLVKRTGDVNKATCLPWTRPPIPGEKIKYQHAGFGKDSSFEMKAVGFASLLRDARYGDGKNNGAALIHGIQEYCLTKARLEGFTTSDEGKQIANHPEIVALIPDTESAPPPCAPEDVLYLMSKIKESTNSTSDTNLISKILDQSISHFRDQVATQYLLSGQNSLPLLLYIRRQITATLADSCATVFCNPYMAAVDVLRRLLSIKLTKNNMAVSLHMTGAVKEPPGNMSRILVDNTSPSLAASQDKIRSEVSLLLRSYFRENMPLAKVASVDLSANSEKELGGIAVFAPFPTAELKFFEATSSSIIADDTPAVGFAWTADDYVASQTRLIVDHCAEFLPEAVRTVEGKAGTTETLLTKHLEIIRSSCLILGIIEQCIRPRLRTLEKAVGPADAPAFKPWFEGFLEYGMIAAFALGQEKTTEKDFSVAIMQSLLGTMSDGSLTPSSTTGFDDTPEIPEGLPDAAKPYPVQLGQFWGWGAEDARPQAGSDPKLIQALLRPECALVGENGAVLAAAQIFSEMNVERQILGQRAELLSVIGQKMSGDIRHELREQLRAT
jgi:gas vesicle protein